MILPQIPPDEQERLAALESYSILDTAGEDAFNELARIAASICGTPIALISLVDRNRQWFKARVGIEVEETPREISFCAHAIHGTELFCVEDALLDPRFSRNPLVTGDPHIRFYAGAPLTTPCGHRIGTLSVIDRVTRSLSEEQKSSLAALARQVMVQMELRRQIAERSLTEARLHRVLEGSNDGFWDWDIASGDVQFSDRAASMLGYTPEEFQPLAADWPSLIHPDDREQTAAALEDHLAGRTAQYECEHRIRCRDGSWLWILDRGKVITRDAEGRALQMAGTHRDISRWKKAEAELRASESRTRSIIENSLGAMLTTDETGVIETANPAASTMFGCSAAELVGRSVAELVDGRYESPRQCLEHLRASALNRVTEWRARRANGETFTCELSLFEFTATDGTRHFAGHILDVSERQEVDRMKKDFVATVSHELRTPLTSIRGSLGLMASGVMGELTPEARQMVSVAERNSVRLIALINDILDFEKLENGRMELELRPTPLQRLLERSVEAVSAVASQEGIEIQLRCPNALVRGDEARLMQVIVNLLSNALKYSDRGGLVTVDAAVDTEWAVIRVSDHGRGIAPHLHKRLFQRFEQLDPGDARTRPGTGLGLAICKAIVEQHGGSVGVESHEGQGSTFWFRVPSVDMTEQARASGEPHRADVLLVEDDAALLEVMSTQLAASGVPVRTARSGASGLAAVAERAPGLIVLDVDLPDIDGYGVVEALREHPKHSSVPLLVYSALDLSIADRRRLTLGPTRYLLKSRASDDDFCSAVGQLLGAEARSELM